MRLPEIHTKGTGKLMYIISFIILVSCYKEVDVYKDLITDENSYFTLNNIYPVCDHQKKMMLFPVSPDIISDFQAVIKYTNCSGLKIDGSDIKSGTSINFTDISTKDTITVDIEKNSGSTETYHMFFTTLPVLRIASVEEIPNEPKIYTHIKIYHPEGNQENELYSAGMEIRGTTAQKYPKLSYSVELWEDNTGTNRLNASLLNMRYDDDWILDAMYKDLARMRNIVSFDLWKEICRIDYKSEKPDARSNIEGKPVELFINNSYQGLYFLNERLDEYQLQLDDEEGVLYKSEDWSESSKFISVPDTTGDAFWNGWELKFCGMNKQTNWGPLYYFINLVVNGNDEEFTNEIFHHLSLDNAIDYFIFMNLIKAYDNMGKNLIISGYNNHSTLHISPWDMDATWGRYWTSSLVDHTEIITNKLYNRLIELNPDNFNSLLYDRWRSLRQHVATKEHLLSLFDVYMQQQKESGAIYRENNTWTEIDLDLDAERAYISGWVEKRLEYLDEYFEDFEPED